MSHFNTTTSTLTAAGSTSNHGTNWPITVTEAMDVDQRPTASDHPSKTMTVTSAEPATQKPTPAPPSTAQPSTPLQPQLVHERPRQDAAIAGPSSAVEAPPSQKAPPPPPPQTSHFTTNLLSAFKLDPLAASVARFDPISGEKINKMRKSYEGQLKQLGLSGKNKSVKHAEAVTAGGGKNMMGLAEMAAWPEEEWRNQKVHGKDVSKGLPDPIAAKLEKAFQLQRGPVPEGNKWEDILGIERQKPHVDNVKMRKDSKSHGVLPAAPNARPGAAAVDEPIRARRNTKKRRYDDGSFEGYGEGFVDDDLEMDAGYESGETYTSRNSRGSKGEKGHGVKRRKTKDFTNSPTGYGVGSARTPSFGGYGR